MFNVGDMVIYSIHGLSRIDDICEKTISNVTKTYYVLHPLDQTNLIISAPVDSDKVVMQKLLIQMKLRKFYYPSNSRRQAGSKTPNKDTDNTKI